ncbi:hypothetical protein GTV32_16145 [Gordonia sp. SID5947]|uniref:hypothetical protein n=1 Tax=Gordonia sp. SID5947 TaxID=2690315 RepID=UPI001370EFD4|nr:hypothetical protein [Gordonia sp. SID5947]MYR07736.1 hypothetical protein [Gordonia sp. SID5947]
MELFAAWCGYLGAWLLVAGPMYQGARELSEEQLDRAAIRTQSLAVPHSERVSAWWWLLPPVAYILIHRAQDAWRAQVMASLTIEQREQFVSYSNKATGWFIVGGGAALIGIKEAFELVEVYEWPGWITIVLCGVAIALSIGYTTGRMHLTARALQIEDAT